jgi:predicted transcriptional regulator
MSTALQELNSFHQFALNSLRSRDEYVSLENLLETWRAQKDRDEVNTAIRDGLADIEAGRYRPAAEVMEEFRKTHGIPSP